MLAKSESPPPPPPRARSSARAGALVSIVGRGVRARDSAPCHQVLCHSCHPTERRDSAPHGPTELRPSLMTLRSASAGAARSCSSDATVHDSHGFSANHHHKSRVCLCCQWTCAWTPGKPTWSRLYSGPGQTRPLTPTSSWPSTPLPTARSSAS